MALVDCEVADFVATICINRPEQLNALNRATLEALDDAIGGLDQANVRAVIVTGTGEKAFVAGADVAEMAGLTRPEAAEFSRLGNAVFRRLETLPQPVIAAVNGYALGGGCELALACDIRLASTRAQFAQPEVGLGIPAGFGGTQRLARLIGPGLAKEMLYSAGRVSAERALAIGLVNAVYEPEALLPAARDLAARIARQAPRAVRVTKAALDRGLQLDLDSGLALESELFAQCFETADQREAMRAFTEKRPAEPFQDK